MLALCVIPNSAKAVTWKVLDPPTSCLKWHS